MEGKKSIVGELWVSNSTAMMMWAGSVLGKGRGTEAFLIPRGCSETVDGKFSCWGILSKEFPLSLFESHLAGCDGAL